MGKLAIKTTHPLLEGSFSRKLGKLDLDKESSDRFKARIDNIVESYSHAVDKVAACVRDELEDRRDKSNKRKELIWEEYNALSVMVHEDYERAVGRLDEYRKTIIAERDSLLKELNDIWKEDIRRESKLLEDLFDEMRRGMAEYRKSLFKYGKVAVDDTINEARHGTVEDRKANGAGINHTGSPIDHD